MRVSITTVALAQAQSYPTMVTLKIVAVTVAVLVVQEEGERQTIT